MNMPDLHLALQSFEGALKTGRISPMPCRLSPGMVLLKDDANGDPRLTFAAVEGKTVKAIVAYLPAEEKDGLPCFQVGYAVAEKFRRRGIAGQVLEQSIREMKIGFGRHVNRFYIEAVVDKDNIASRKVAEEVIAADGTEIVDDVCGRQALQFFKLIDCRNSSSTNSNERFIYLAQGSAGVLEAGSFDTGLYTDKIATCRPYVFVCKDATIMLHDTGQIELDAIATLIAKYGKIKALHYVEGRQAQEGLHHKRLLSLAQRLQFKKSVHRPVAACLPSYASAYSVAFTRNNGLRILTVDNAHLFRDPNHDQREAVNMLNDTFTPAKSQSAPLDVQYAEGIFAPPPVLIKSLLEMLKEVIVDGNQAPELGLYGIGALSALMPEDQLPAAFLDFVKEHELGRVSVSPIRQPAWFADPSKRLAVMAKFKTLPIFEQ